MMIYTYIYTYIILYCRLRFCLLRACRHTKRCFLFLYYAIAYAFAIIFITHLRFSPLPLPPLPSPLLLFFRRYYFLFPPFPFPAHHAAIFIMILFIRALLYFSKALFIIIIICFRLLPERMPHVLRFRLMFLFLYLWYDARWCFCFRFLFHIWYIVFTSHILIRYCRRAPKRYIIYIIFLLSSLEEIFFFEHIFAVFIRFRRFIHYYYGDALPYAFRRDIIAAALPAERDIYVFIFLHIPCYDMTLCSSRHIETLPCRRFSFIHTLTICRHMPLVFHIFSKILLLLRYDMIHIIFDDDDILYTIFDIYYFLSAKILLYIYYFCYELASAAWCRVMMIFSWCAFLFMRRCFSFYWYIHMI